MDAIRKDEDVDETHSIYVDQWDWEKVVSEEKRTVRYLQETVKDIYSAIVETKDELKKRFPELKLSIPKDIHFIHSEELLDLYPTLDPKEREDEIAKKYGAVFIIGIGHKLKSGDAHDLRATDYDDWSMDTMLQTGKKTRGINGDIIVWDKVRSKALEISSMGIRVNKDSLIYQLKERGEEHKFGFEFHTKILSQEIPQSIGGGIGQSRLCMFLLEKAHIAEVQSSVWPKEIINEFEKRGIPIM